MSRKTGLIISWNWTRNYGIVQEQELPTYDKGDIVMVLDESIGMDSYDTAEVLSTDGNNIRVKLKTTGEVHDVHLCCIREKPTEGGKQMFVHQEACVKKDDDAKGFAQPIGKGRVWYNLWERVYFDYGKNNGAINVSHVG